MEEPGRLQSMRSLSLTRLSDFTFTFHFHALEKEMATHSSVLAWRIPGTGEPGGLPSLGSHRVGHNWSNLAAAAAYRLYNPYFILQMWKLRLRKVKWSHTVTWLSRNRNENDQGVGAASFAHFHLYLRVIACYFPRRVHKFQFVLFFKGRVGVGNGNQGRGSRLPSNTCKVPSLEPGT